ncbi:spore cortex biosynthesis protein YabQ [Metabacillus fastidiosus]|uniref:spore cortex biosynthesis protein YabQ n=1 Tax=Metabacillus fastidiosus TaxID=1458 RepID=UPI002E24D01A|nr:spore cortex biosynthesis protein YabQ [Metabacillus fastidiosus]MED4533438.1 spore cortex biosynthesis protein YabQ [Metabacillus fastidiosus]
MTLTTQFYTMLAMVGMGGWIGLALDTHGRFLKRPTRARWFVFINDLLFWIVQGLILFYLLLLVNEGELRVYLFLALVCGYASYQSLLKSLYLKVLEILIHAVLVVYNSIIGLGKLLIIRPFVGLLNLIITIILGLLGFFWSLIKWILKFVYSLIKILLTPVHWILKLISKMIPLKIRNIFTTTSHNIKGFFDNIKNKLTNILSRWKQRFRK